MLPDNRNKKGTGFTNLNRVLQANQGNRLGSTVAGGVQQVGQNVRQQTQQAQQSFQTEAEKNRVDTEQNKQDRSNILGRFNTPQQPAAQQTAPQVTEAGRPAPTVGTAQSSGVDRSAEQPQAAAPSSGTQQPTASSGFTPVSDEEVNKFARFRTGAYSGPRELENIDQLSGKAMEAEQIGQLSRSTGGRQELLRRFVGGQDYNQGQQRLDTALLGLTGQEGLAQARRETRGLGMDLAQANQAASGFAQELANRANIFGQETRDQIQQVRNPITGQIENRVQTTQADEAKKQERFQKVQDIISGKGDFSRIPKEQRAILGLNAAASDGLLSQDDVQALVGQGSLLQRGFNVGADVSSLIGERLKFNQAQNLTKAGLATDEERSKLSGLNRLAGGLDSDFEFAGQDGRFQAGRGAFDYDSMNREIQRAEDEKARNDAAYRTQLEADRVEQNRFFNRAMSGTSGALAGTLKNMIMPPTAKALLNPMETISNPGAALSNIAQGQIDVTRNATQAAVNAPLAIQEGIMKLNIGGESLGNTEVGKQLLKVNEGVGNFANKQLDYGFDLANQFTTNPVDATGRAINDLGSNISPLVQKQLDVARNTTREIANAPLSLQEGLLKLNIGGQSLGNTDVGKQLLKLNQGVGNFANKNMDYAFDLANQFTSKPIDAAGRVIGDAFNSAGQVVTSMFNPSSVGRRLKKIFCFAPDTEVLMADGKYKKIKDISVSEQVALGGKVISNGEALATDLYQYGNVRVTGGHAVFENGKWKRVSDSQKSYPIGTEESVVYPIVTENHLIVTKDQVWADAFEIDNFKTPDEYSLEVLNQNKPRNRKLQRFVEEYFGKDPNQFEKIKTPF